jgi:hypothetical protein
MQMNFSEPQIILLRKKLFLSSGSIYWFIILIFFTMIFGGDVIAASNWKDLVIDASFVLLLLTLSLWPFIVLLRQIGVSARYHINHDGLFLPSPVNWLSIEGVCCPILIRWDEIKALIPYSIKSGGIGSDSALGIVLWDYEALLVRSIKECSPGPLRSFFIRVNTLRLVNSRVYHAPVNLPQYLLPVSIDELLGEIRTRFSAELEANGITVLDWRQ